MRRLFVVAVLGLLVGACGDNSQESPLGPNADQPSLNVTPTDIPCPPPRFPVINIARQIEDVFPRGALRIEALAREAIIAALWTKCRPARAQEAVASFVAFTLRNFQADRIGQGQPRSSTPAKVSDLIDAMLGAVLLSEQNLPLEDLGGSDFGTGFADGTSTGTTTVTTTSGAAGATFQGNAWGEPTVVTIFRLPDDSDELQTEGEAKFAPFYDYNASNASNNHFVVNGELFVGFCLEDTVEYPDNVEIGHNPPSGDFFEILQRLTESEYQTLGLTCEILENPAIVIGLEYDQGLRGFAASALRVAAHHLKPLAGMVLPQQVYAVAPRPNGVGGRTTSYSPFGVVEPSSSEASLSHEGPEYSSEESGDVVTRTVFVESDGEPLADVDVTFTTEDGGLGNESSTQTVSTDDQGRASVSWLLPGFPGVYTLSASIPGSSLTYTVAGADDGELTPLSCSLEGTLRSLMSEQPVDVTFTNNLGEGGDPVSVFWLNTDGLREYPFEGGGLGVPYAVLETSAPDSTHTQPTYVTHPWILTTPGEPETCYGIYLPLSPSEGTFGGTVTLQPNF